MYNSNTLSLIGIAGSLLVSIAGCGSDSDGESATTPVNNGTITVQAVTPSPAGIVALAGAIEANPNIGLGAQIDHQASVAGLQPSVAIPSSTVFAFGNPNLGTPIMLENPLAAIDLPLRMLVWGNAAGGQFVSYDGPGYLSARYGLQTVEAQLTQAMNALAGLASQASGTTVAPQSGDASGITLGEGLTITPSANDAATTFSRLQTAIAANPALGVAATIDHKANAERVGLTMGFSTVIWFGNPAGGAPLITQQPRLGLDLPLKVLVAETPTGVVVAHNAPAFLAQKHGMLESLTTQTDMMTGLLQGLAATAAAAQ